MTTSPGGEQPEHTLGSEPPGADRRDCERRWTRNSAANVGLMFFSTGVAVVFSAAAGKAAYDATGRELYLGLIGLAEFLPRALLVFVTGSLADRLNRAWIVVSSTVIEALVCGGVALYLARTSEVSVAVLIAAAGVFGIAQAFRSPAARALMSGSVTADVMPWLVVRWVFGWQIAAIGAPIVMGYLYARAPWWAFALAVAFAVGGAAVALALVRAPGAVERERTEHGPGLRDALAGVRVVRRTPVLLAAISLDLFAVLFGGAIALLPAIADERLHVGTTGFGWLRAAPGIGSFVMTLWLARRPIERHVGRSLLFAVAVFGVGHVVLGVTTSFVVAFAAVLVAAAADGISVFIRHTLVPLVTPPDLRGRVNAVESVFIGASNELGAFESGVTAQALGTAPAVAAGGALTLAVVVAWWKAFPELVALDRFPTQVGASDASLLAAHNTLAAGDADLGQS